MSAKGGTPVAQRKGGLGKGLDSLFANNGSEGLETVVLRLSELEPNRGQPRRQFDQSALEELASSIREVGIIQPIIVRNIAGGGYQIVAGERRWRAAQMAGLQEVPVVIRELSDQDVAEYALIENLQREDLNAMELAEGYRNLIEEYGMTQEQVAARVGKSRPVIANAVRLLELPQPVQAMLRSGELTAGHAKVMIGMSSDEDIIQLAQNAVRRGMTVREVEKEAQRNKNGTAAQPKTPKLQGGYVTEVELALGEALGRRVRVTGSENRGKLEIEYFSREELESLANILAGACGKD